MTTNLSDANYVDPPITIRELARIAGITGAVSVRTLIGLLGDRREARRPFYVIAHGTNTIEDVNLGIDRGANAVEVDVTAYASNLRRLCVAHAGPLGDSPADGDAPGLNAFLHGLRAVADSRPQLALVVFDCKPPAATPEHGRTLLKAIRDILTSSDSPLNVIISVAEVGSSTPYKLNGTTIFDQIASCIGPREGLMIDAQDDPDAVAAFFGSRGCARSCYGNGTSVPISDDGAMVYRTPIERACWRRMTQFTPRYVHAWTVNSLGNQRLYLRLAVNGMISDLHGVERLSSVLKAPEFAARLRVAARLDNPFLPSNAGYGLTVRTSDVSMAGTDANLIFTVTGANGSAEVIVDSSYNRRMERDSHNFVVLESPDLGELQSVTVRRDNEDNAPDWHLDFVIVESFRYRSRKTATFGAWIKDASPVTRPLV